jgi:hypothetical protein
MGAPGTTGAGDIVGAPGTTGASVGWTTGASVGAPVGASEDIDGVPVGDIVGFLVGNSRCRINAAKPSSGTRSPGASTHI